MRRVVPPEVMVTDGGSGIEKARRRMWHNTATQRCLFHVFCQAKRYTTTHSKLPAGQELYRLARALLHIHDIEGALMWLTHYNDWFMRWNDFLKQTTLIEGRRTFTHERLVKARNSLNVLIKKGTLLPTLIPIWFRIS